MQSNDSVASKLTVDDELRKPLPPDAILQRPDGFSYIDQTYVIPEANRIFGALGWSCEVLVAPHIVAQHTREVDQWEGSGRDRKKTGKTITNYVAVVVCTVRVTIGGVHKDGEGACTAEAPIDAYANSLETAFKGAVTDGMKRAFILLGERFGISLYDRKNKQKGGGGARSAKPDPKATFDAGVKSLPAFSAARASGYLDRLEKCGDKATLAAIAGDVDKDPAHETLKPLLRPAVDSVKRKLGIGPKVTEPPASSSMSFKFGNKKDTSISDLADADLTWYRNCFERDLADKDKARFHDKTRDQIAAIDAELAWRAAQPAGKAV